jgi:hypothetical protein
VNQTRKLCDTISRAAFIFDLEISGDIMTNPSLTTVVAALAGMAGVAIAAPGLAKSPKQVRYTAPVPVVVVYPLTAPQFITVGPNGYWITTTWGCWVDDGQWRIHDCDGPGGG